MSALVAVALAALGACALAWSSVLQHAGVGRTAAGGRTLGAGMFARLVHDRVWLAGVALLGVGVALHVAAVATAPISLVQPVGVLAVPLTVFLGARHAASRERVAGRYRAAWLTVAATVVFVAVAAPSAASPVLLDLATMPAVLGAAAPLVVGLALLGVRGPQRWRGPALAAAAGVAFGVATALVRCIAVLVETDGLADPALLGTLGGAAAAGYAVGAWCVQQAYLVGRPETVMGTLTVVDPFAAVAVGMLALGEGARLGLDDRIGLAGAGALAVLGIALLSRPGDPTPADDTGAPSPTRDGGARDRAAHDGRIAEPVGGGSGPLTHRMARAVAGGTPLPVRRAAGRDVAADPRPEFDPRLGLDDDRLGSDDRLGCDDRLRSDDRLGCDDRLGSDDRPASDHHPASDPSSPLTFVPSPRPRRGPSERSMA
ncbi:DMT family transporter [Agilicoccus flavus]|uniref:DMT family transporter n=1 Tax=Agilicoccus flavus TaxID=2775968 RepID=UPI001CF7099E|nr:DMT family transporter [Agilicoccus flavus]